MFILRNSLCFNLQCDFCMYNYECCWLCDDCRACQEAVRRCCSGPVHMRVTVRGPAVLTLRGTSSLTSLHSRLTLGRWPGRHSMGNITLDLRHIHMCVVAIVCHNGHTTGNLRHIHMCVQSMLLAYSTKANPMQ